MPFRKEEDYGTNASGDRSEEYCVYCFENGKFLDEGITLEEKINKNVRFGVQMECLNLKQEKWHQRFCLNSSAGIGKIQ